MSETVIQRCIIALCVHTDELIVFLSVSCRVAQGMCRLLFYQGSGFTFATKNNPHLWFSCSNLYRSIMNGKWICFRDKLWSWKYYLGKSMSGKCRLKLIYNHILLFHLRMKFNGELNREKCCQYQQEPKVVPSQYNISTNTSRQTEKYENKRSCFVCNNHNLWSNYAPKKM